MIPNGYSLQQAMINETVVSIATAEGKKTMSLLADEYCEELSESSTVVKNLVIDICFLQVNINKTSERYHYLL